MFNIDDHVSGWRRAILPIIEIFVGFPVGFLLFSVSRLPGDSLALMVVGQIFGAIFACIGLVGLATFWLPPAMVARYRRWSLEFPESAIFQVRTTNTVDYYLSDIARNSGGRVTPTLQFGAVGMLVSSGGIQLWSGPPSRRLVLNIKPDRILGLNQADVFLSASRDRKYPGVLIRFLTNEIEAELGLALDDMSKPIITLLRGPDLDDAIEEMTSRLGLGHK